jgi:hypothetical protein
LVVIPGTEPFFLQMCADPELAPHAKSISDALDALDREGDGLPDAAGLFHCLYWVLCHREHGVDEKLAMVDKLIHLKGRQEGTPRELTGWR